MDAADQADDGGSLRLPVSLEAGEYRRLLADVDDDELSAAFAANRRELLDELFLRRMPDHFDPATAEGSQVVIEWRVLGREDGGYDRFQVSIQEGRCTVSDGGEQAADVVLTIKPAPLLKMMVGLLEPVRVFTLGKVKLEGDLLLAARAPGYFRFPHD